MKITINLSPPLALVRREAEAMGVSFPALLTADMQRYRTMAAAAVPPLDEWERGLLPHILDGIDAARILTGDDSLPGAATIAADIEAWADRAGADENILRAEKLARKARTWPPLAIAGLVMRERQS